MTSLQSPPRGGAEGWEWPPAPFRIDIRPARERVMVVPVGELDLATVGWLAAAIDELVERGFQTIVVDLRELSFMDSSGVHLLLEQTSRLDAKVTVIDGSNAAHRVIELAGVGDLLAFDGKP